MTARKSKTESWAIIEPGGRAHGGFPSRESAVCISDPGDRVVRLVEADPVADRVLKAAVRYAKPENDAKAFENFKTLFRAVMAYTKIKRRK